ncbi:unnamed protein product [Rhizophagus irregularis]|nr:unnamed protein product [Rhizophagus irregularis]
MKISYLSPNILPPGFGENNPSVLRPLKLWRHRKPETVEIDDEDEEQGLIESSNSMTYLLEFLGLVLPHVHTGKDLLLERRLSHSTYRENNER